MEARAWVISVVKCARRLRLTAGDTPSWVALFFAVAFATFEILK